MAKYELRKGGKVVEKIEARHGGHEDTRLGLAASENESGADGWVKVEAWTDPQRAPAPVVAKTAVEKKAA